MTTSERQITEAICTSILIAARVAGKVGVDANLAMVQVAESATQRAIEIVEASIARNQ